jgi:hypothetical protein
LESFYDFELEENMGTGIDQQEFARWLLDVGDGSANDNKSDLLYLSNLFISVNQDFRKQVYTNKITSDTDILATETLTPLNTSPLEANEEFLLLMIGATTTCLSKDSVVSDDIKNQLFWCIQLNY